MCKYCCKILQQYLRNCALWHLTFESPKAPTLFLPKNAPTFIFKKTQFDPDPARWALGMPPPPAEGFWEPRGFILDPGLAEARLLI